MRKSTGSQAALFDRERGANTAPLIAIPSAAGPINPTQRTFNRLTERIRHGRERLAAWEAFIARITVRAGAELQPLEEQIRAGQRRVLALLQGLLGEKGRAKGENLARRHQEAARALLLQIVDDLLQKGPDPELEALHDRYSEVTLAEENRQDLEATEALFGEIFGEDFARGHRADSVEDLLDHTAEKLAEEDEAWEQARRGTRAERPAPGKAQAQREATAAVREVYRKLVSALHPDRETDPAEHARKTRLLQRVNDAHASGDLLGLLSLQIEIEQLDAAALAELPEARLRRYNQVLLEQARTLEAQIEEHASLFAPDHSVRRGATPEDAERAFNATLVEARAKVAELGQLAERLLDTRQRRAALEEYAAWRKGQALTDLLALEALFAGPDPGPAKGRSKRRRRKRKK